MRNIDLIKKKVVVKEILETASKTSNPMKHIEDILGHNSYEVGFLKRFDELYKKLSKSLLLDRRELTFLAMYQPGPVFDISSRDWMYLIVLVDDAFDVGLFQN